MTKSEDTNFHLAANGGSAPTEDEGLTHLNMPRFGDDWRMRWFYLEKGHLLHRIAAITFDDDDRINGHGATACGRFGFMWMPGLMGRMGATRCPGCCDAAGVPRGRGAPFNEGIEE